MKRPTTRRRTLPTLIAVTTFAVIVLLLIFIIIGPSLFRGLLPANVQAGIARRIPIFSAWVATTTLAPTREYSAAALPTTDPKSGTAAAALLNATEPPVPTATSTSTPTIPPTLTPTVGASETPLLGPTIPPTNTPAPSATTIPTNTSTPLPTVTPIPAAFRMDKFEWVPQTWNNCGPANLTQVLNHFGHKTAQADAAAWLKPSTNDANVSPREIVAYVNEMTPLRAIQRYNGNIALLKRLIAARFGVLIETGLLLPEEAWMGHYLTMVGYDDVKGNFYVLDSYLGTGPDHLGIPEKYATLDYFWQHFNRVYMVIYPPEREAELFTILGADADPTVNAAQSLSIAKQEAQANPANPYAWFNMGTSYILLGDYANAASAYDQSRNVGEGLPYRMLWYQFGPFSAYYKTGDYASTLNLINATLGTTTNVEEIWYWRGLVSLAQGNTQLALADLDGVLRFNPNFKAAADAQASIKNGTPPAIPDLP